MVLLIDNDSTISGRNELESVSLFPCCIVFCPKSF